VDFKWTKSTLTTKFADLYNSLGVPQTAKTFSVAKLRGTTISIGDTSCSCKNKALVKIKVWPCAAATVMYQRQYWSLSVLPATCGFSALSGMLLGSWKTVTNLDCDGFDSRCLPPGSCGVACWGIPAPSSQPSCHLVAIGSGMQACICHHNSSYHPSKGAARPQCIRVCARTRDEQSCPSRLCLPERRLVHHPGPTMITIHHSPPVHFSTQHLPPSVELPVTSAAAPLIYLLPTPRPHHTF
jgi:hypothetical protein